MKPNTPGFIGEKLREAREARGLNATQLSELLSVSRASVSKYELDLQSPSPEVMENICRILKLPVDFFLVKRKRSVDLDSPIFYRSMSAATKTQRLRAETRYIWLQDIFAYLWQFVEFPSVNLPVFDLPNDPTQISNDMIEDVALEVRKFWGLGHGPISNITWLLENNGIVVSCYKLEAQSLDAFSQLSFDRPHIIVGADKNSGARLRFNAAHELGHLILHRNLSKKFLGMPQYFKLIEAQAHRFSGAFHFTQTAFAEEVKKIDLDYFRILKSKWKISIQAMVHRAKDLDFIDGSQASLLARNLTRRGWRTNEPLDDEILCERPQLLRNAFEMIIDNRIQQRSDVLYSLRLNPRDIEEIAALEPNYLSERVIQLPLKTNLSLPQLAYESVSNDQNNLDTLSSSDKIINLFQPGLLRQ